MYNTCIFINIYDEYFCKLLWLSAKSPDVFGTTEHNVLMYTEIFTYILDDSVLPTLWQQFGEVPFLFQHDNALEHKARTVQKSFVKIGVAWHRALNTFGISWMPTASQA